MGYCQRLSLHKTLRHHSAVGRDAYKVHTVGQTADIDAHRILFGNYGIEQLAIYIVNLHARNPDAGIVGCYAHQLGGRVRVEGKFLFQINLNTYVRGSEIDLFAI